MSKAPAACLATLVLAAAAAPAGAADFTCFAIDRAETAAQAANRLSGAAWHSREPWFQVFDPAAGAFVSKAEYEQMRPGWRACLANDHIQSAASQSAPPPPTAASVQPIASEILWRLATMPEAWWVLSLILTMAAASDVAAAYSPSGRARTHAMTRFGRRFVQEFERPLLRPVPGDRAIDSRLRVSPLDKRLDILLAPRPGRLYPNLSDHKTNVEYDVARVLNALGDQRFVLQRLSAEGRWVLLRCRIKAGTVLESGT